jgi:hypothetical protein
MTEQQMLEMIDIQKSIIKNYKEQIQDAHDKLDRMGVPNLSVRDNQLTILGRLDYCSYQPPNNTPQIS